MSDQLGFPTGLLCGALVFFIQSTALVLVARLLVGGAMQRWFPLVMLFKLGVFLVAMSLLIGMFSPRGIVGFVLGASTVLIAVVAISVRCTSISAREPL